ncbi:hypothetical protein [Bombilactobacillus apium]|uniref:hypothetical protein n=1 Tax=Bombilactobacillus apium TaxID=2675299 RepID=UPI0015A1CD3C|nr:hypothetical protein [Bombilactobacillus apium]
MKMSESMIGSDVVRFEPRGIGYSEGEFYNLTHKSWLADIAGILHETLNSNNYTTVKLVLMSDASKMIVNILEKVLKKLDDCIKWQIILINGILTKENKSGPNKTRIIKMGNGNWGLYTGFGVYFSLDFLDYYPDKDKVRKVIHENRKNIFGIYGMKDDLTINSKLLLKDIGIQTFEIREGDHLFTSGNCMKEVIQSIKEIYNNY